MKVTVPAGMFFTGRMGPIVYCRRGNTVFARAWVRPKNPRSVKQRAHRGRMEAAVAAWKGLSEEEKDKYRNRAKYQSRTGYNLFISEFMVDSRRKAMETAPPVPTD